MLLVTIARLYFGAQRPGTPQRVSCASGTQCASRGWRRRTSLSLLCALCVTGASTSPNRVGVTTRVGSSLSTWRATRNVRFCRCPVPRRTAAVPAPPSRGLRACPGKGDSGGHAYDGQCARRERRAVEPPSRGVTPAGACRARSGSSTAGPGQVSCCGHHARRHQLHALPTGRRPDPRRGLLALAIAKTQRRCAHGGARSSRAHQRSRRRSLRRRSGKPLGRRTRPRRRQAGTGPCVLPVPTRHSLRRG